MCDCAIAMGNATVLFRRSLIVLLPLPMHCFLEIIPNKNSKKFKCQNDSDICTLHRSCHQLHVMVWQLVYQKFSVDFDSKDADRVDTRERRRTFGAPWWMNNSPKRLLGGKELFEICWLEQDAAKSEYLLLKVVVSNFPIVVSEKIARVFISADEECHNSTLKNN